MAVGIINRLGCPPLPAVACIIGIVRHSNLSFGLQRYTKAGEPPNKSRDYLVLLKEYAIFADSFL
jgi:hypothetical protein